MPDRHSKEYYAKKKIDWDFIGVDGEGSTDAEGNSIYQVLAANVQGEEVSIENKEGLTTIQCLEFLLSLPYRQKRLCVCGYGFTYDVCNMLRGLEWKKLQKLAKDETIGIYIDNRHRYRIRHIYKKAFEIWKLEKVGKKWRTLKYVRVYDVFGFYQTSFLKAIEEWKIGTEEELEIIDEYKARRGEDLENDWDGWKRYNAIECRLLVKLMKEFYTCLKAEDIHLSNWWGAGAIAAFWFKRQNIKEHLTQSFGEEIDDDIMRAYFGGHIQRLKVGIFKVPVYRYDICSAYPWGMSQLPSLKGEWREVTEFDPEKQWSLYEIDWDFSTVWNSEQSYGPLIHRTKNGSNLYPKKGNGVFWYPEIKAVLDNWPECIKVIRGRVFEPYSEVKPFSWVPSLFERRNRLKKEGDPRNVPLKLGLNSLYGKTVQGKGMLNAQGKRMTPPYQSYMWGGLITSMTRARMINAIATNPPAIIAGATDGIFSVEPLPIQTGTNLGDWQEEPTLDSFELYANGVYKGSYKGKKLVKARGFEDREFDFDSFAEKFSHTLPEDIRTMKFIHKVKRFYGYKLAVHRNKPELFCKWGKEDRKFMVIGIDCFEAHSTNLRNVYRIECTLGKYAKRIKEKKYRPAQKYIPPQSPMIIEQDIMSAEQPAIE